MPGRGLGAKDPLGAAGLWPGASLRGSSRPQPHPSAHALPPAGSLSSADLGCSHTQQGTAICLEGLPGQPAQLSQRGRPPAPQWTQRVCSAPARSTGQTHIPKAHAGQPRLLGMREVAGRGLARWALALCTGEAGVTLGYRGEPR